MTEDDRREILLNAQRFREDAKLLCDAGRYPSCALLQIFCFEELGKYHLAAKGITSTPRDWHLIKQQTALSLAGGIAFQRRVEEKCIVMGWDYLGNDAD